MKRTKNHSLVFTLVAAAFVAIVLDTAFSIHPIADIIAGCLLLAACYAIGKE